MATRNLRYFALSFLLLKISLVHGAPYVILRDRNLRCFHFENLAPGVFLSVDFNAPDLDVAKAKEEAEAESPERTQLTVMLTYRGLTPPGGRPYTGAQHREVHNPTESSGTLHFRTLEEPGSGEVCLQVPAATKENPHRVSLVVTSSEENYNIYKDLVQGARRDTETVVKDVEGQEDEMDTNTVGAQTDQIIKELERMDYLTKELYRKLQISQKINNEFQEKSVNLNSAVHMWPVFRVVILLVTGFIQARSVIGYMRRKHIY